MRLSSASIQILSSYDDWLVRRPWEWWKHDDEDEDEETEEEKAR